MNVPDWLLVLLGLVGLSLFFALLGYWLAVAFIAGLVGGFTLAFYA